jgi:large subunit ribosomal protein L9
VKVILIENVDRLGHIGEVVNVADGYARNYLIPKNLARVADEGNVKMLDALKKKQAAAEAKKLEEAKAIAEKIEKMSITISAQAGDEDKLFGSITADMIAAAVKTEGVEIDKKVIHIDEPIKKLGSYQATVKVHPEVKAVLRVWIVKAA